LGSYGALSGLGNAAVTMFRAVVDFPRWRVCLAFCLLFRFDLARNALIVRLLKVS
jgi:hypothetical protein